MAITHLEYDLRGGELSRKPLLDKASIFTHQPSPHSKIGQRRKDFKVCSDLSLDNFGVRNSLIIISV